MGGCVRSLVGRIAVLDIDHNHQSGHCDVPDITFSGPDCYTGSAIFGDVWAETLPRHIGGEIPV